MPVFDDERTRDEKFLMIYNEYRTKVYHCAMNVLKDSYLAEDAVQEVFLKFTQIDVLNKIDQYNSPRAKAYINVLTKHVVYNMFNKRKRYCSMFVQDEFEKLSKYCIMDDNTETVFNKYDMEELADTLHKLPTDYSNILVLRYIKQLNDKELAILLHIKEATARKRLERARKLFKVQYRKDFNRCEIL